MDHTCEYCKWWRSILGECRFSDPQIRKEQRYKRDVYGKASEDLIEDIVFTTFPKTSEYDYCGQWEERQDDDNS